MKTISFLNYNFYRLSKLFWGYYQIFSWWQGCSAKLLLMFVLQPTVLIMYVIKQFIIIQ